jgi:hypothetical protein
VTKFFSDQRAEIIQIRHESGANSAVSQSVENRYVHTVENIPLSAYANEMDVILISEKGELADQYLGPPRSTWKSKDLT